MDRMLKCRILVIIPAHNEEVLIKNTIRTIKNVEYPVNKIDIVVIADRCTDNTVEIAKNESVEVYDEIENDYCTKGGILQSFFEEYSEKINQYDYVCIIDADTYVDKSFFIEANRHYKNGCKIVQSKIQSKRRSKSIIEGFMTAFQSIQNVFFYKTLNAHKRPVILAGKGMLFTPDVFSIIKWDGRLFIEDVDISFQAILSGIPIIYSEKAVVSCLNPSDLNSMWKQQRRWTSGQYFLIRKYFSKLIKGQLRGGALLFGIEGVISVIAFPMIIIALLYTSNKWMVFTVYYLLALLVDLTAIRIDCCFDQISIRDVLSFPFILLLWFFINLSSAIYPTKKWT